VGESRKSLSNSVYEPSRRAARAALGVVALVLFAAAVAVTWIFLRGGFRGGVPVDAVFSAPGVGQQLPVGGDVKIRGVLVGTIANIRYGSDGYAVVEMRLDDGLGLPADTAAEIRSKTVFGQKWLELLPPEASSADGILAAGSVIPDERTTEPLELERALQLGHDLLSEIPLEDLATIFDSLARGFVGQEEEARRAIDRGLVALRAVNSREGDLDLALRQLGEFSQWLDENDESLLSFMQSIDSANRALVGAAPELRSNLQSVPSFLDRFAAFQERTEADLGVLVEEGAKVAEALAARSESLVDLVVQLEAFLTVFNSGLSQPCGGLYESNMTCWQVYLMPGIESRGIYRSGEGPDVDERGDPGRGGPQTISLQQSLSDAAGRNIAGGIVRLLYEPLIDALGPEFQP
jgi:phospholipid/cholesterol/gamma-HCH transport system substrate-binding protein